MKRIALVFLCLLLCLTGAALAENADCTHENALSSFEQEGTHWWHFVECPDCGLTSHLLSGEFVSDDEYGHNVHCPECGMNGPVTHIINCGTPDGIGTCIICDEENVSGRIEHNRRLFEFDTANCYYDCVCGENFDTHRHAVYCDSEDKNTCVDCGKNTKADGIVILET